MTVRHDREGETNCKRQTGERDDLGHLRQYRSLTMPEWPNEHEPHRDWGGEAEGVQEEDEPVGHRLFVFHRTFNASALV